MQLEVQLADRGVSIELTKAARGWLAARGYDPLYGARPLSRVIQEHVKKPLADELLFGSLSKGGIVRIDIADDKPVFRYTREEPRARPKPKRKRGKPAKKISDPVS